MILKVGFLTFFQGHLALYSFANGQISTALKLYYRARYLALLICGENHPEIALWDVSNFVIQGLSILLVKGEIHN